MRVIAGELGGLSLTTVSGRSTRPTGAKVKEAMFNILNPYLTSKTIGVDLFAGSGALGIEAISHGIAQMYLVDKSHAAIKAIKANVSKTHLDDRFKILPISAQQATQQFIQKQLKFDLLILDPPYVQHVNPDIVATFIENKLLNAQAIILLETDYDLQDRHRSDCSVIAAKQYGQTFVEIWQYKGK
ncbi:16S rRNA (guanine(966)-N(2))-methyltransferase RsmD [Bombilactobacillus bombi]|uniref:16S rRNA (guanine(966)-N(2))-methyltransferase RsmD n=1 Tax=Bombilactobacillus bombi TaxID=1303590 RepID=UPI000E56EDC7|nr:16S rRNA (guanine(966)-N(2))-methyltransferase RsmD [Bombilactobacillus bombi]AXX64620.1 16S rRNA (guanine(966)-N(2))-methyltransferase RsmD [Bombilactobacillus bombi]